MAHSLFESVTRVRGAVAVALLVKEWEADLQPADKALLDVLLGLPPLWPP